MIECLLKLHANPDAFDFSGRTPLMHAAELGHVTALGLLRAADANAAIQDFEGRGENALLYIIKNVRIFFIPDAVYYCVSETTQEHKTCFKMLLEMGANVNNQTKSGLPNLVYVCEESFDNEEYCMGLIRKGADVHLVDEVN